MNEYHWRYTGNRLRLFQFDAGVFFPLLLLIIHPAKGHWSFSLLLYASLASVIALIVLDRRGFTSGNILLYLRARVGQFLGGGKRPVESHIHLARRRDYVD